MSIGKWREQAKTYGKVQEKYRTGTATGSRYAGFVGFRVLG